MKLPFVRASRKHSARPTGPVVDEVVFGGDAVSPSAAVAGGSGSQVFLEALAEAARRFPDALGAVRLPSDAAVFRRSFPEVLVRFEGHRAGSKDRVEIARTLVAELHAKLFFREGAALVPLAEYLARAREPIALTAVGGKGEPEKKFSVPWRKETFNGAFGLYDLIGRMRAGFFLTDEAQAAFAWMAEAIEDNDDVLDLSGERFALLGAGAELSPTELLLDAGADVLWIDRAAPPERLLAGDFPGRLYVPDPPKNGGLDLLTEPGKVRQAIIDFSQAAGGPVHLGLYAYAPGKGRELRLAALMDAIARSLPAGVARSVTLLVSPTTPGEVGPAEKAIAIERRESAQVWKKTLERTGFLSPNCHETIGPVTVSRSVVSLQGATYQAAQYLAKMMAAEALLADGIAGKPVAISANVAGITATRSLLHPLFQAGFLGAPRFGIEIYEPATTRTLSCLLSLHDVLSPKAPGAVARKDEPLAERAHALTTQAIHGGCRSLPWVLEPTIRVGALIGLGKRPQLLAGLIPRKKR